MSSAYVSKLELFEPCSGIEILDYVPIRPKSGFQYIYTWKSELKKANDCRADGYRWRQNARKAFTHLDSSCHRYYFKLQIAPNDFTSEFSKHAITSELFSNKILIWYEGDQSVAVDFSHGNRIDSSKVFVRTVPSLITEMKNQPEKMPLQVYSALVSSAPPAIERHQTEAPRNLKQVQNALGSARFSMRLSKDVIYNLTEIAFETRFISDIHLHPYLTVVCFRQGIELMYFIIIDLHFQLFMYLRIYFRFSQHSC